MREEKARQRKMKKAKRDVYNRPQKVLIKMLKFPLGKASSLNPQRMKVQVRIIVLNFKFEK